MAGASVGLGWNGKSDFIMVFTRANLFYQHVWGSVGVLFDLFEHRTVWMQAKRNYMDTSKASNKYLVCYYTTGLG